MIDKLKSDIKRSEKTNRVLSIMELCAYVLVFVLSTVGLIVEYHTLSNVEKVLMVTAVVVLFIAIIGTVVKKILPIYRDSKLLENERYEYLKVVLVGKRKISYRYAGRSYIMTVKVIDTNDEFAIETGENNMVENEQYLLMRAKHSKVYAFAPLGQYTQEN